MHVHVHAHFACDIMGIILAEGSVVIVIQVVNHLWYAEHVHRFLK